MFLLRSLRSAVTVMAPYQKAAELRPFIRRGFHGSTTNKNEITKDPIPAIPIALRSKISAERDALHSKLSKEHVAELKHLYDTLSAESEEQLKQFEAENKEQLKKLEAEHEAELKKLEAELEAELKHLYDTLSAESEEQLKQLSAAHEAQLKHYNDLLSAKNKAELKFHYDWLSAGREVVRLSFAAERDKAAARLQLLSDRLRDEEAARSRLKVRITLRSIAVLYLLMLTKICRFPASISTTPNSVRKVVIIFVVASVR